MNVHTYFFEGITPLEYINQHVIVTRDRRLFYNLVFECNEQNVEMTRKDALHLTKRYMDTQVRIYSR